MMRERIIDGELTLVPYYPLYDITYEWYQDPDVCKQVDNIDTTYTLDRLIAMYTYLSTHGECYYIRYQDTLVGDVSLLDSHCRLQSLSKPAHRAPLHPRNAQTREGKGLFAGQSQHLCL